MLPARDRWTTATWTAIATVLLVAALTATASWRWQESRELSTESNLEIQRGNAVLTDLVDMETGQRGFLLTGEDRYLEPYRNGSERLKRDLAELHASLRTDAQQVAWGQMIDGIASRRIAELDSTILFARTKQHAEAVTLMRSGRGKAMMDSLRGILADLTVAERERQRGHVMEEDRWAIAVRVVLVLGTALTLGVLLFLRRSLVEYAAAQRAAAREMTRQLAELEEQSRALFARERSGGTTA
jgi:CHASE3 domain sensor protein